MFAILIQPETVELIAAMNEGVVPEPELNAEGAEYSTFFVHNGHDQHAEIISSRELQRRLGADPDWEPLQFAIWRK